MVLSLIQDVLKWLAVLEVKSWHAGTWYLKGWVTQFFTCSYIVGGSVIWFPRFCWVKSRHIPCRWGWKHRPSFVGFVNSHRCYALLLQYIYDCFCGIYYVLILNLFIYFYFLQSMQKLLIPFEMRGYQRVYNLEKKVCTVQNFYPENYSCVPLSKSFPFSCFILTFMPNISGPVFFSGFSLIWLPWAPKKL